MTIKIDNNVALPRPASGGPKSEYMKALESMKRGQSFLLDEKDKAEAKRRRDSLCASAWYRGIKIATRWTDEGMRIWRVK